jgi:ankyrin repeat protein
LDNGADLNAVVEPYGNALQVTSFQGHPKIVELFLNNRADVNAQVGEHGYALLYVCCII